MACGYCTATTLTTPCPICTAATGGTPQQWVKPTRQRSTRTPATHALPSRLQLARWRSAGLPMERSTCGKEKVQYAQPGQQPTCRMCLAMVKAAPQAVRPAVRPEPVKPAVTVVPAGVVLPRGANPHATGPVATALRGTAPATVTLQPRGGQHSAPPLNGTPACLGCGSRRCFGTCTTRAPLACALCGGHMNVEVLLEGRLVCRACYTAATTPQPKQGLPTAAASMPREQVVAVCRAAREAHANGRFMAALAAVARLAVPELLKHRVLQLTEWDALAARTGKLPIHVHVQRDAMLREMVEELGWNPMEADGPRGDAGECERCTGYSAGRVQVGGQRVCPRCATPVPVQQVPPAPAAAPQANGLRCAVETLRPLPGFHHDATPAERAEGARIAEANRRALGDGSVAPLRAGDWAELGRRVQAGLLTDADARGFAEQWLQQGAGTYRA